MSDADFDFELKRLFFVFGSGIALCLLFFVFRVLKVFFLGRRFRGVIAQVRAAEDRDRLQYSYVVEYEDPLRGRRLANEQQQALFQEYKVGDAVNISVREGEPPVCEIISGLRLLISLSVILLVVFAMLAAYEHFSARR